MRVVFEAADIAAGPVATPNLVLNCQQKIGSSQPWAFIARNAKQAATKLCRVCVAGRLERKHGYYGTASNC